MILKMRQTKTMRLLVVFLLLFTVMKGTALPTKTARADEYIRIDYQDKLTLSIPMGPDYVVVMSKKQLGGKEVVKVKSNNKNVSVYISEYSDGGDGFELYTEKVGKATITITLEGKGKTVKKKMVVTFVKYENPIVKSSFVTSSMVKELNQYPSTSKDTKKKSEKIVIKVKKGWQVTSIKYEYSPAVNKFKTQNVKNGANLKLQEYGKLHIQVKNLKKNYIERVVIRASL